MGSLPSGHDGKCLAKIEASSLNFDTWETIITVSLFNDSRFLARERKFPSTFMVESDEPRLVGILFFFAVGEFSADTPRCHGIDDSRSTGMSVSVVSDGENEFDKLRNDVVEKPSIQGLYRPFSP